MKKSAPFAQVLAMTLRQSTDSRPGRRVQSQIDMTFEDWWKATIRRVKNALWAELKSDSPTLYKWASHGTAVFRRVAHWAVPTERSFRQAAAKFARTGDTAVLMRALGNLFARMIHEDLYRDRNALSTPDRVQTHLIERIALQGPMSLFAWVALAVDLGWEPVPYSQFLADVRRDLDLALDDNKNLKAVLKKHTQHWQWSGT